MNIINIKLRNVVMSIVGLNILFFIIQNVVPGFTENFLLVSADILVRPWILLTSAFLHGPLPHLFFNMYALIIFGPLIEARIGSKRFLLVYLIAAVLASLGFALINPAGMALGASGAMMAILGLTIMLLPNLKVLFFFIIPMSMRTAGIIFACIDVFGMFNPASGIAHIAHLVGLGIGLAYGFYLLRQRKAFAQRFTSSKPSKKTQHKVYKDATGTTTIELTEGDINDYLKNGRL